MSDTASHPTSTLVRDIDRAIHWHHDLRATMTRLDAAFKAWEVSPRLAAPWRHFTEGMADHLHIEEDLLFPALKALAEGRDPGHSDFETPLNEMQYEIDEIETISDALRNASPEAGELERDLLEMLDQLDIHAEKEQNVIFPEAARLVAAWKTSQKPSEPKPEPQKPAPDHYSERDAEHAPHISADPGILFRAIRRFKKLVG